MVSVRPDAAHAGLARVGTDEPAATRTGNERARFDLATNVAPAAPDKATGARGGGGANSKL